MKGAGGMVYDFLLNVYKTKPDSENVLLWMSKDRYHIFHQTLIEDNDNIMVQGLLLKGATDTGEETFNTYKVFNKQTKTIIHIPRYEDGYLRHIGYKPYPAIGYAGDKKEYTMKYKLSYDELVSKLTEAPPYPVQSIPKFPPRTQLMAIQIGSGDIRFMTNDTGDLLVIPPNNPLERIPAIEYCCTIAGHTHEHIRAKLWLATQEKYNRGFELKPFKWGEMKLPDMKVF